MRQYLAFYLLIVLLHRVLVIIHDAVDVRLEVRSWIFCNEHERKCKYGPMSMLKFAIRRSCATFSIAIILFKRSAMQIAGAYLEFLNRNPVIEN